MFKNGKQANTAKTGGRFSLPTAEELVIAVVALFFGIMFFVLIFKDIRPEVVPAAETPEVTDAPVPETPEPVAVSVPPVYVSYEAPESEHQTEVKPDYRFPEDFLTAPLDASYFSDCPEPGSVQHISYAATDYATGQVISKNMDVYLPYAYSSDRQYNVIILTHGASENEHYWFSDNPCSDGSWHNARFLLDNMIYSGVVPPVIAVSVTCTNPLSCSGIAYDTAQLFTDGGQLARELQDSILPTLVSTFSTYADGSDEASLIAAREHFGYVGLSWGAMMGYMDILPKCLPYIAWYGLFSSGRVSTGNVSAALRQNNKDYPLRYLFTSSGTADETYSAAESIQSALMRSSGSLTENENCCFLPITGGNHSFETWAVSLYDCLLLFFD